MTNGIIADDDVLQEDYIPQNIPCRENQKKELAYCISPVERGRKPFDCLCYGKPGTGKTALVKFVLNQINENTSAYAFYVNCWENKTLNQVLDDLLRQAQLPIVEANHSVKITGLRKKIKGKACIIALDEIDKLDAKELNDVLYLIKEIGNVGIVCISNTRKYLLNLDQRITSRLSFKSINFPLYSNQELITILKHRVEDCRALYPDSCTKEILEAIADLAAGDARIAIQTLRNSACIAEKTNRNKITLEDAERAYEEIKEIKRKYILEKLGSHHRLIVEIVKKNPNITSSDFYELYKHEAKKDGLGPKSERMFSYYVNELIRLGYLRVDRAKTRGNVRVFSGD